ncbi:hypothetical protein ACHAXH_000201 [Discostella pseudostelligera]
MIRNLRSLPLDVLISFNPDVGAFEAGHNIYDSDENDDEDPNKQSKKIRKIHAPHSYLYKIGEYYDSTYFIKFLSENNVNIPGGGVRTIRDHTRRISCMPKSTFRAWFRMPLAKVEALAARFVDEEWLKLSKHCSTLYKLKIKSELMYIYLPREEEEVRRVMADYEEVGLPGAVGSMDVVHVKWSNCPAGDFNRAKGKESYPSLAFQCISDYNRRICHVFGPQFGSRNDKHIVKMDDGVAAIREEWYKTITWTYFDANGDLKEEAGVYLICDNGYLQWPITICPFMRSQTNSPRESAFSANMESVRKDVECVFGILKARWGVLDRGFKHRSIQVCQDVFIACCVLHNMMLDEMEREEAPPRIGRGCHMPHEGMWLEGPSDPPPTGKRTQQEKEWSIQFHRRRNILADHLRVWKSKCKAGQIVHDE